MSTIECRICLLQYDEEDRTPRVLTRCGHTVCQQCAMKLAEDERTITCPFDGKVTVLTRGLDSDGVTGLQKNFALLDLARGAEQEQEENAGMESVQEHVPCLENPSHEAVVYCQQCEIDFCDICFTSFHKAEALSVHQKINISEKSFKLPKCPSHPHNTAEFFCTDRKCKNATKIMCQTCVLLDPHKSHKHGVLMEKLVENEHVLKKAREVQEFFQKGAETVIEVFNQSMESYEVTGEAFQNAVQSISDQFDMKKREAICKLTQFANEKKVEQAASRRETEEICNEAKEFGKLIENLKKTKDLQCEDKIGDWVKNLKSDAASLSDPHNLNDHEFILSKMKLRIKEKADVPIPPILQKLETDMISIERKYLKLAKK